MTKEDIADRVKGATGMPRYAAYEAVGVVLDVLASGIVNDGRVELRDFGIFGARPNRKGCMRNPKENIRVEAVRSRIPYFKPGKRLKAVVNSEHGIAEPPF